VGDAGHRLSLDGGVAHYRLSNPPLPTARGGCTSAGSELTWLAFAVVALLLGRRRE
jgi:uncharacterized protein (TIGR03382 family)